MSAPPSLVPTVLAFEPISGLFLVVVPARNTASVSTPHLPVSLLWRDASRKVLAANFRPSDEPHFTAYRAALKAAGVKIHDH